MVFEGDYDPKLQMIRSNGVTKVLKEPTKKYINMVEQNYTYTTQPVVCPVLWKTTPLDSGSAKAFRAVV